MGEGERVGTVLQDWVTNCSMMQQSVLMGIVRGPDGVEKYHPVKPVLRWYRRCLLFSAIDGKVLTNPHDPNGGSFTGPSYDVVYADDVVPDWTEKMDSLVGDMLRTMDQMNLHFWLHMLHAFEIMGYHHSDPVIAMWWTNVYYRMVNAMHLYPETKTALDRRLGDTRAGWEERSDPAITK